MPEYESLIGRIRERACDPRSATDERVGIPPVSDEDWEMVERMAGVSMPPTMRQIYFGHRAPPSGAARRGTANPPVSLQELEAAEQALGFSLPRLLRAVYLQVGNGGFGPGHGLLRLNRSDPDDRCEESVVSLYQSFHADAPECPQWRWPTRMLPICDWGCALRSCVDCGTDLAPVFRFDPELLATGDADAFRPEAPSLYDWLEGWVENRPLFWLPFARSC